jgi:hypothetical protein
MSVGEAFNSGKDFIEVIDTHKYDWNEAIKYLVGKGGEVSSSLSGSRDRYLGINDDGDIAGWQLFFRRNHKIIDAPIKLNGEFILDLGKAVINKDDIFITSVRQDRRFLQYYDGITSYEYEIKVKFYIKDEEGIVCRLKFDWSIPLSEPEIIEQILYKLKGQ